VAREVTQARARHLRRPGACPLLLPAVQWAAVTLVALGVAITTFLGVWFAGQANLRFRRLGASLARRKVQQLRLGSGPGMAPEL
jgi:hypothetical protein